MCPPDRRWVEPLSRYLLVWARIVALNQTRRMTQPHVVYAYLRVRATLCPHTQLDPRPRHGR
jgi:hypothetical protein